MGAIGTQRVTVSKNANGVTVVTIDTVIGIGIGARYVPDPKGKQITDTLNEIERLRHVKAHPRRIWKCLKDIEALLKNK